MTFRARAGKTNGGSDDVEPIKLRGAEFVCRWSLHILPEGYTKTRRFGGYWNCRRETYIVECRELLAATSVAAVALEPAASSLTPLVSEDETTPCCPKCQSQMRWIDFDHKPSWRIVMQSPHCPALVSR